MKSSSSNTIQNHNQAAAWANKLLQRSSTPYTSATALHKEIQDISQRLNLRPDALESLLRNKLTASMKKRHQDVKVEFNKRMKKLWKNKKSSSTNNSSNGGNDDSSIDLVELAGELKYPPYALARFLVELVLNEGIKREEDKETSSTYSSKFPPSYDYSRELKQPCPFHKVNKKNISQILKAPSDYLSPGLSKIVQTAIQNDPLTGLNHEESRRKLGLHYEEILETKLKSLGLPYENEEDLRERGSSKTPDILLKIPVGVFLPPIDDDDENINTLTLKTDVLEEDDMFWREVCWIDSKAMYGDEGTHRTEVLPQAEAYLHRFGPGLILYWFGCHPSVIQMHGDVATCCHDLPQPILLPTGKLLFCTDEMSEYMNDKDDDGFKR